MIYTIKDRYSAKVLRMGEVGSFREATPRASNLLEGARNAAAKAFDYHADEAAEGWSDDAEATCGGRVVMRKQLAGLCDQVTRLTAGHAYAPAQAPQPEEAPDAE